MRLTLCGHSRGKLTWDRNDHLFEVMWGPPPHQPVSEWSHWEKKHTDTGSHTHRATELQVDWSLIPRLSSPPVCDCLQLCNIRRREGEKGRGGRGGGVQMWRNTIIILHTLSNQRTGGGKDLEQQLMLSRSCLEWSLGTRLENTLTPLHGWSCSHRYNCWWPLESSRNSCTVGATEQI